MGIDIINGEMCTQLYSCDGYQKNLNSHRADIHIVKKQSFCREAGC